MFYLHRVFTFYCLTLKISQMFRFITLLGLLFQGCLVSAQLLPQPDHVVVLIMENHDYSQIIGEPALPYLNSLVGQGALFTNYYALTHPSQPNYIRMFSGDSQGVIADFTPLFAPFSTSNLGAALLQNNRSFFGFSEDLPYVGYTGSESGKYVRKHAPWVNWIGGSSNAIPASKHRPLTDFPTDFNLLPTVSFVIPNLDNDLHDNPTDYATSDTWIQTHLDAYIQWAKTHNSLLILTFDEGEVLGDNKIATIMVGEPVKLGQYATTYDHYDLLRTLLDMYNLPACGESDQATPMVGCWKACSLLHPAIVGNADVCTNGNGSYAVQAIAGTVYNWVITGGTIVSGQGTPQVQVQWTNGEVGTVNVEQSIP